MLADGKIQRLNTAIREAIPNMQELPTRIPTLKCWFGQ